MKITPNHQGVLDQTWKYSQQANSGYTTHDYAALVVPCKESLDTSTRVDFQRSGQLQYKLHNYRLVGYVRHQIIFLNTNKYETTKSNQPWVTLRDLQHKSHGSNFQIVETERINGKGKDADAYEQSESKILWKVTTQWIICLQRH